MSPCRALFVLMRGNPGLHPGLSHGTPSGLCGECGGVGGYAPNQADLAEGLVGQGGMNDLARCHRRFTVQRKESMVAEHPASGFSGTFFGWVVRATLVPTACKPKALGYRNWRAVIFDTNGFLAAKHRFYYKD